MLRRTIIFYCDAAGNFESIVQRTCNITNFRGRHVAFVINETKRGTTLPFLARYRRDATGNMTEVDLQEVVEACVEIEDVDKRRKLMLKSLENRKLMTPELKKRFEDVLLRVDLDSLWEPFKIKRESLAERARKSGFDEYATKLVSTTELMDFRDVHHIITAQQDGTKMFNALLIEKISRAQSVRDEVDRLARERGELKCTALVNPNKITTGEDVQSLRQTFYLYQDYQKPLVDVKSWNFLAISRGASKGILKAGLVLPPEVQELFEERIRETFAGFKRTDTLEAQYLRSALSGSFRAVAAWAQNRMLSILKKHAETESLIVFSHNFRQSLLQRPLVGARVLAMDPGYRFGCKCICLDEYGSPTVKFVLHLHEPEKFKRGVNSAIKQAGIKKIAIGNGTGAAETLELVEESVQEGKFDVEFALASEAGASVYSSSSIAIEEFPELDVMYRGAVNIGRRIQDPLTELVKIPPQSLGIGMYQHDLPEKKLSEVVRRTAESCVCVVGVNIDRATVYVLRCISCFSKRNIAEIVSARDEGKLKTREDLRCLPSMTPELFQQVAGFFLFPQSSEPLDATNIHPESYKVVRKLFEVFTTNVKGRKKIGERILQMGEEERTELLQKVDCGAETLMLVAEELRAPAQDPREDLEHAGVFRQKQIHLQKGDKHVGIVRTFSGFGYFVDIGASTLVLAHGRPYMYFVGMTVELQIEDVRVITKGVDDVVHATAKIVGEISRKSDVIPVGRPIELQKEKKRFFQELGYDPTQASYYQPAPSNTEHGATKGPNQKGQCEEHHGVEEDGDIVV